MVTYDAYRFDELLPPKIENLSFFETGNGVVSPEVVRFEGRAFRCRLEELLNCCVALRTSSLELSNFSF